MGTLGYEVRRFADIDPSTVEWKRNDITEHNLRIEAVIPFLKESHAFRRKALDDALRVAQYKANLWLDSSIPASAYDSVNFTDSSAGNGTRDTESLVKAQAAHKTAYRQRFYPVPLIISAAQQRIAGYGAMALDYEMSRLTTCDADLTIADVGEDASNRIVKGVHEAIKWTFLDKLAWEFRSVIKNEWDENAGVELSLPVTTGDARSYRGRGKDRKYRVN